MKTNRIPRYGLAIVLFVMVMSAYAGGQEPSGKGQMLDCRECHTCDVPTAREPCLRSCPRAEMVHQTSRHGLAEAPDSMVLDILSNLYKPVHFNHRQHASMAAMDRECATCHHFSPPGKIPPCEACHAAEGKSDDLTKPNLKGAYHRQCLSCHREWSHSTKCVACHVPSENEILPIADTDPTDIIGKRHPLIAEPVTRVYSTPYKKGPVVTFQHKEHVELFGFRCVDCHSKESCGNCHDVLEDARPERTQEEIHAICNGCHADAPCEKCHDTKERPGFTHNSTGWPLSSYHRQLDCWSCHPAGRRISRLSRMCVNCHASWNQETFRHAVTSFVLDDLHSELDCTACHVDYRYEQEPACSDCHDDGRTAQTAPPGERVHHKR